MLGVTYKPDISDIRESPALDVMQILKDKCLSLKYSDPYVSDLNLEDRTFKSEAITSQLLRAQDAVVILTDHSKYDIPEIMNNSELIIDTRNATRNINVTSQTTLHCDVVYI